MLLGHVGGQDNVAIVESEKQPEKPAQPRPTFGLRLRNFAVDPANAVTNSEPSTPTSAGNLNLCLLKYSSVPLRSNKPCFIW